MMSSKARLLGWSVRSKQDEMKQFRVQLEDKYPLSLLTYYIQTGQFRAEDPFGLDEIDGNLILTSNAEPTHVTFSNKPLLRYEAVSLSQREKGNGVLGITAIYAALAKAGYRVPLQNRSFLGKSKGHARNDRTPLASVHRKVLNIDVEFEISEAENFEVVRRPDEDDIVLYDPRHTVCETRFSLDTEDFIPEDVRNHEVMQRTVDSVDARFRHINEVLVPYLSQHVNLVALPTFDSFLVPGPLIELPNGITLDFTDISSNPFEKRIASEIEHSFIDVSISVAVESSLSNVVDGSINSFVQLLTGQGTSGSHMLYFTDPADLSSIDCPLIIILDDRLPGASRVHRTIKIELDVPNKVFLYSTVAKGDLAQMRLLAYLAILHRRQRRLYHSVKHDEFDCKIGLSFSMAQQGRFFCLGGATISDRCIVTKRGLLARSGEPFSAGVTRFLGEMTDSITGRSALLYVDNESLVTPSLLEQTSSRGIAFAVVRQSNSVLLGTENGAARLPIDGQYIQLSDSQCLLTTNGAPNNPQKGIPSPVFIEMYTRDKHAEILRSAFWDTFVHPTSVKKTKLPLALYVSGIAARTNPRGGSVECWESAEGVL